MTFRLARNPRRGMTVVAVLVCLIVLTLIGAALLKLGLARRRINRDFESRLQAEWLVESGVDRALARMAVASDYKGETWRLSAADLGLPERVKQASEPEKVNPAAAIVTIAVDRPAAEAPRRRVRVHADYTPDGAHRSRCSQELLIDLEPTKAGATP